MNFDSSDEPLCVLCRRQITASEIYGANGVCSECLEDGFGEHHGG